MKTSKQSGCERQPSAQPTPSLLHQHPEEIGGHQSLSYLQENYSGRCSVNDNGKVIAVLPNPGEAKRVAIYATSPDGGSTIVAVYPTDAPCTHMTFEDWL